MEIREIEISKLVTNKGQIPGLPKNPRILKDYKFEKLKKSLLDLPDMLSLRELLVFPHKKQFIVIAGNMRLEACKAIGYEVVPCKVLDEETSVDDLKAILIRDNISYGEHDMEAIFNEWDVDQLIDWGMDIVIPDDSIPEEASPTITNRKLIVECELPEELEKLFGELQNRGFVCELK